MIRLRRVGLRLVLPAATPGAATWTARGPASAHPGVLLALEDEEGRVGQGEASPLPGFSRESAVECARALRAIADGWSPLDVEAGGASTGSGASRTGVTPRTSPPGSTEVLLALVASRVEAIDAALPAARFALETALLDLAGQRLGRPLQALLAGAHRPLDAAPCSSLLTAEGEAELLAQAAAAMARGHRTLKWKVGRPGAFARELAMLSALRRAVGPAIALRLDANGAFPIDEVGARLAALAAIAPELIEEPSAGPLDRLPAAPRVPVAVDERLADPSTWPAVEQAIVARRVAAVVLKPTLLGGAIACLRLARRASALGASALVTHAFEGPVGLAAVAALALALPSTRRAAGPAVESAAAAVPGPAAGPAAGIDRHPALAGWPELALPMLAGGAVVPWAAPGLGLPLLSAGEALE